MPCLRLTLFVVAPPQRFVVDINDECAVNDYFETQTEQLCQSN